AFFDEGLDDKELVMERNHLLEQRRTALTASPMARLDTLANEELWPTSHPLRVAALSPQAVEGVDRAAVLAFHRRWITPSHATLAVVGDVVAADAFAMAERYFGTIPRGPSEHL